MKDGTKSIHDKDSIGFMKDIIGAGKWQLSVLREGLSLDLKVIPTKYKEKNNVSAVKNMKVLQDKVQEWRQEGYVERLSEPAWCCNPMSVAVKFDPVKEETKLRPCIDLSRHVNKCTRVSHAKLDDLSVAQELISKDDYMASFDLANQFFHVRLHEADKKFFGFEIPGVDGRPEFYQFTVMVYGYSPAVEVVTRLLRPVKAYLHSLGIKLSIYVDDGLVSASTAEQTWKQFQFVLTVIQLCGWNIQMKKTSTEAVQKLAHLGFITDSVNLRYWLPVEKEDLVVSMLESVIGTAMEGRQLPALELAKLLGRLNSMRRSHGTVLGVLTRTCQHLLGVAVNRYGWQCRLTLDYEAVRELQLLASKIRSLNGQHIFSCEARSKVVSLAEADRLTELVRTTDTDLQSMYMSDASDSHVYIYNADGQFQYVREFELTAGEKLASSGYRELLAVKRSLQEDPEQFKEHKGGTIFWQTNSNNCYGFLLRGSRQPDIQRVVMDIKCMERRLDINIVPVWTPRTHGRIVTADLGSKMSRSTDEWCVDRDDLVKVFTKLNFVPEVDCMATRSNTLCENFFPRYRRLDRLV